MKRIDLPNVERLSDGRYRIRARKRVDGALVFDVKRTITADSPLDAALEQRRLHDECEAGRYRRNRPLASITLGDWCERCIEELRVQKQWRANSLITERTTVRRFGELLDRKLRSLQVGHVEKWHATLVARVRNGSMSQRTYRMTMFSLRRHLDLAAKRGLVARPHPSEGIVLIRVQKSDKDVAREPLTLERLSVMLGRLAEMDERTYRGALAYYYLMATTGCRKMEPANSDVSDFDLEGGWWTLRASITKTGGTRGTERVPIPPTALSLLKAHATRADPRGPMWVGPRTGERVSRGTISMWWRAMCRAAGVPDTAKQGGFKITDLRRAAASIYARRFDTRTSSAVLRHDPRVNAGTYDYDAREHLKGPAADIDQVFATALGGVE